LKQIASYKLRVLCCHCGRTHELNFEGAQFGQADYGVGTRLRALEGTREPRPTL
jgi:hypothetical protein